MSIDQTFVYEDTHGRRVIKHTKGTDVKWLIESDETKKYFIECPLFMVKLFNSSSRIKLLTLKSIKPF